MLRIYRRFINVFRRTLNIFESRLTMLPGDQQDKIITEGKAKIFFPKNVFYNPVQEFNRDMSIAVTSQVIATMISSDKDEQKNANEVDGSKVNQKVKQIRILEALAATGLRSIRFALEIPHVTEIVANDFDEKAVEYIRRNAAENGVYHLIKPSFADASMLMYQSRKFSDRFQVIDLDPYGSPTPFLDAAIQSIADGGLLSVTCTDMAVLCGNSPEKCHSNYGSVALKSRFCHELALRILLRSIESHANRYSRYISPLLSISVDFYCRVFVRISTSQQAVKQSASKLSHVFHCTGCGSFHLQRLCEKVRTGEKESNFKFIPSSATVVEGACKNCLGRHVLGGPIWSDPIHDPEFVEELLLTLEKRKNEFKTSERMIGILTVIKEELQQHPLYYDMDNICATLHCKNPGFVPLRSALLNGGYKVSLSHASKNSLKTDAPMNVIWDIMRCWVKDNPVSESRCQEGSVAYNILKQDIKFKANFTPHPDANPPSRRKGLLRWQINPMKDWGPKPKAGREEKVQEKKRKAEATREKANKIRILEETLKYPCKRFQDGSCQYGKDCVYRHETKSCEESAN